MIRTSMENKILGMNVTFFFCQQLDPDQDVNRRRIEKEFGTRIKFFPLPCSGRIEPLHFMRAFESGADLVFLITCPEKACRYEQGNKRAKKRLQFTKGLIQEVGLDPERLILVTTQPPMPKKIDELVRDLMASAPSLGRSVLNR
jgi:F420-non-reducing hydrogenase iron-sulfur subunit